MGTGNPKGYPVPIFLRLTPPLSKNAMTGKNACPPMYLNDFNRRADIPVCRKIAFMPFFDPIAFNPSPGTHISPSSHNPFGVFMMSRFTSDMTLPRYSVFKERPRFFNQRNPGTKQMGP